MKMLKTTVLFAVVCAVSACSGGGSGSTGTGGGKGGSGGSGTGGGTAGGSGGGSGGGSAINGPRVASTKPRNTAPAVAVNVKIAATFSGPMDATTLTATSFTVKQGTTVVAGAVTYAGNTATFTPTANLAGNSTFTASISTAAKSLGGVALGTAYAWNFTTGTMSAQGPAPVGLGTAGNYVSLAKTAISSVPASVVTGNVGLSPAAASFVTGFSLVADATNVFSTATQVIGQVFAADYAVPTPINLTTAVGNMETAYTDAAGRSTPNFTELGTGNIGGLTLAPGLYNWTSTVTIPTDVTISGGANDVWIFQTSGDLTMSAMKNVTLAGGAQAKHICWQVAGTVTIGANSHFEGIILCKTEVTLLTSATMNGRILAQTQIALQQATLTQPAN